MNDKSKDLKSNGCATNNASSVIKRYYIEYLIKNGGKGFGYKHANDFAEVERIFAESHPDGKCVLVAIKFVGIILDGRYYKSTDNFE